MLSSVKAVFPCPFRNPQGTVFLQFRAKNLLVFMFAYFHVFLIN